MLNEIIMQLKLDYIMAFYIIYVLLSHVYERGLIYVHYYLYTIRDVPVSDIRSVNMTNRPLETPVVPPSRVQIEKLVAETIVLTSNPLNL